MKITYFFAVLALVLMVLASGSSSAVGAEPGAMTFTVTKTADTNDGACTPADCSLREAVIGANAAVGADTIIVPPGMYRLAIVGVNEEAAATGDLDITDDAIVRGNAAAETVIDAGQIDRIFHIFPAVAVTLEGFILQNGWCDLGNGAGILSEDGRLTLSSVTVRDNETGNFGGGVFAGIGYSNPDSSGTLTILRSAITDNKAIDAGGLFINGVRTTIVNSHIARNEVFSGGGGLYIDPLQTQPVLIQNSTIVDNVAAGGGGIIAGLAQLQNTILARNSPNGCELADVTSLGNNLIDGAYACATSWQPSDRFGDPGLGSFVDDSIPGQSYYMLAPTSLALDAANNSACPPTDQIGATRPVDGNSDGSAICDIGAVEYPPYYNGGENKLALDGWFFLSTTPGVGGSKVNDNLAITVNGGLARACWHQELAGAALRGKAIRYEAEMHKTALMNSARGFANPYISLQVQRGDGSWQYNYGGIGSSTATPGGPWVGRRIDVALPNDMKMLRASFCVWDATAGTAEARALLLRLAVAPPLPPPALGQNLLSQHWTWAPATLAITGLKEATALAINVSAAKANGCWLQDMPGAALRGATVRYEASMAKTGVLNRTAPKLFVNPYISLQAQTSDGVWHYNHGGVITSRSASDGLYVTETRDIVLPGDLMTLRASFCVWQAQPGTGRGKDLSLRVVNPLAAQGEETTYPTWEEYMPDTPSALAEDVAELVLPEMPGLAGMLYLPLMQKP